jgi:mono/diheme cytochrome c family protein
MARAGFHVMTGLLMMISLASGIGMVPAMDTAPDLLASADAKTGSSDRAGSGDVPDLSSPAPIPAGDAARGQVLYDASCIVCHGVGAAGAIGPRLAGNSVVSNDRVFWDRVLRGGHMMPPLGDALTSQQIADIQSWLKTLR